MKRSLEATAMQEKNIIIIIIIINEAQLRAYDTIKGRELNCRLRIFLEKLQNLSCIIALHT